MKQKYDQLSRTSRTLFVVGFIAITLIIIYIAGFLKGLTGYLLIEFILYAAIVATYIQAFRASPTPSLVLFTRVMSYAGIVVAILIASFSVYFVATFRW